MYSALLASSNHLQIRKHKKHVHCFQTSVFPKIMHLIYYKYVQSILLDIFFTKNVKTLKNLRNKSCIILWKNVIQFVTNLLQCLINCIDKISLHFMNNLCNKSLLHKKYIHLCQTAVMHNHLFIDLILMIYSCFHVFSNINFSTHQLFFCQKSFFI